MKTNINTAGTKRTSPFSFVTGLTMLFVVMIGWTASAQDASARKTISGTVRFSEDSVVAPGVNIYLKGSTAEGTYSNENGEFEFPRALKDGDILVFSFIGRKTHEYIVSASTTSPLNIVLGPDYIEMVESPLMEGEERTSRIARLFRRSN